MGLCVKLDNPGDEVLCTGAVISGASPNGPAGHCASDYYYCQTTDFGVGSIPPPPTPPPPRVPPGTCMDSTTGKWARPRKCANKLRKNKCNKRRVRNNCQRTCGYCIYVMVRG